MFLPHDAMCKRRHCCRPVSLCPSVCLSFRLSRWWIVSKQLKTSSNFFLGSVARYASFLTPSAGTQFQGEPLQLGRKVHGGGEKLRFSTEIAVYLGNGTI